MTARLLALLAALAVILGAPAAAAAHPGQAAQKRKAKVFVATLKPASPDVANYTSLSGKARLVARKRRATVKLTARGLAARRTYRWAIVSKRCRGPRVARFTYKRLRADRRGRAKVTGATKRFKAPGKTRRYVVVYQARTKKRPLMCGRLRAEKRR